MNPLRNSPGMIHGRWVRNNRGRILFLLVAIMALLFTRSSYADQGDGLKKVLRAGFLSRVLSDVDPHDAQATLELLTREISRNMGLKTTPWVILFPDISSMADARDARRYCCRRDRIHGTENEHYSHLIDEKGDKK